MTITSELCEFTTEQLLEELLSRPTFAGIVIHSEEEVKYAKIHRDWCMISSPSLNLEQIHIVLKEVTDKLEAIL